MSLRLDDYAEVAPQGSLLLLRRLADQLTGRRFLHCNASRFGGGSPELLARLVPLLADLGIDVGWEVIVGDPEFYATAQLLHVALQGGAVSMSEARIQAFAEAAASNAATLPLEADLVLVHDLAAMPLVRRRPARGAWVWDGHCDLSSASRSAKLSDAFRRALSRAETLFVRLIPVTLEQDDAATATVFIALRISTQRGAGRSAH